MSLLLHLKSIRVSNGFITLNQYIRHHSHIPKLKRLWLYFLKITKTRKKLLCARQSRKEVIEKVRSLETSSF